MLWFDVAFDARPLQAAVARLGPHPKILAITAEPGLGHPLVRALNGTWISRQQGLWVQAYLEYMRQHDRTASQSGAGYLCRSRTCDADRRYQSGAAERRSGGQFDRRRERTAAVAS